MADTSDLLAMEYEAVSHERQHSCCDPGCARGGGAIDDDPVVINFQPPR